MTAAAMDEAGRPQAGLAKGLEMASAEELRRLLTDARAARAGAQAREEALAEVLQVMNRHPGDPQPVFELIARHARALCAAEAVSVFEFKDDLLHPRVLHGYNPETIASLASAFPRPPSRDTLPGRAVLSGSVIHVHDMQSDPEILQAGRALGVRVGLVVPLLSGARVIGCISLNRFEKRPFQPGEIALVESFAAQAVIAMENARLIAEQREALERQTATAEVLGVINASPGNLVPVFDAILEKAMRLCEAAFGTLFLRDGENFHSVAARGVPKPYAEYRAKTLMTPRPGTFLWQVMETKSTLHVLDILDTEAYRAGTVNFRAVAELGGARTMLHVPLLRDGTVLGIIVAYRQEVRAFTDKQIDLLQNFAAQAEIAMENARLITEQREALERQTATAEVLGVINTSPGNLVPVFHALLEKAMRLCGAAFGSLYTYDGTRFESAAQLGVPEAYAAYRAKNPPTGTAGAEATRTRGTRKTVQIADMQAEPAYRDGHPGIRAMVDLGGARTVLAVPLLRDETYIGYVSIYRQEVRPFADKQIALLENFAAQAVIAMENARLLGELRHQTEALAKRNSEFGERIDQQAATIDVLKVMSATPGDPQPVFDLIAERARVFAGADGSAVTTLHGDMLHLRAHAGAVRAQSEVFQAAFPRRLDDSTVQGRAILAREAVLVPNVADDPRFAFKAISAAVSLRSMAAVPMLRGDEAIGAIILARSQPGRFADIQLELLQTFAEQAVIAITSAENHRALQARTAELARSLTEQQEALEQQKASAEILNVISTSMADPQPVFEKILASCKLLFGGDELDVLLVDDQGLLQIASYLGNAADIILPTFPAPWEITPVAPALRDLRVMHYPDVMNNPDTPRVLRRVGKIVGYHSIAFAPMIWEGRGIGAVGVARAGSAFSDRELAIMQGFADQAVIAIQNARMFREVREARDTAESTLAALRRAQDRLVQSEKMASLGQLTAGIAHEIKNPLNFVNNFSDLSADLLDELNEALAPVEQGVDAKLRSEIEELTATLKGNLAKIAEHGRRADSIVRNMLEHSRTGVSERRMVDLNATAEEALNLAYHGARAEIPGFNITLEKDLAPDAGTVELYPQEFTRVLVNLINNGFHATRKRAETEGAGFEPVLRLSTRAVDGQVEIRVRDNGTGIPAALREKIFEPFFTTKPAGEGTGLGLSLSYDIVVKQHGGQLNVASEPGVFTEFTITLPRRASA